MDHWPALTLLVLTPLAGALITAILGERAVSARAVALSFAVAALFQACWIGSHLAHGPAGLQFVERYPWIPSLGVDYFVGVDGVSYPLILLSALVVPLSLLLSWGLADRPRAFHAMVLLIQGGLFGAFTALNFFHWFIYWELVLIPAYFLIKNWGGPGRRAAATQFFVYTMAGSVALLLAMQAVYIASGTFDLIRLAELARSGELARGISSKLHWLGLSGPAMTTLLFTGVFLGFAVKVPAMPFHTWLPDTYSEAPSPVTILLTGAMSKMGVYGLVRILLPIFPGATRDALGILLPLALLTIVASAFAACVQKDLKRLLAYSSINHLGYCLLGVCAAAGMSGSSLAAADGRASALNGVVLQMFSHGITAALLFGFVALLERRTGGRRSMEDFGGIRLRAPVFAGLMGISLFASLGLPGLSGFVGEFLIFKGVFAASPWAAALGAIGLLVTAVFLLGVIHRVFNGALNPDRSEFRDLTLPETLMFAPLVVLVVVVGVCPSLILQWMNPAQWDSLVSMAR